MTEFPEPLLFHLCVDEGAEHRVQAGTRDACPPAIETSFLEFASPGDIENRRGQVALHSVLGLSLASSFRNSGDDALPPGAFRAGARWIKEGHGNRLPCTAFAEAEEPGRSPGC